MCKAGGIGFDPKECNSCGACGPVASKEINPALGDIESLFAWKAPKAAVKSKATLTKNHQEASAAAQVAQIVLSGTPAALYTLRSVLAVCKRGVKSEVRDIVDAGVAEVLAMELENARTQSSAHYVTWSIAKALVQGPDADRAVGALLDAGLIDRCTGLAPKNRASALDVLAAFSQDPSQCVELAQQGGVRLLLDLVEAQEQQQQQQQDTPVDANHRKQALALLRSVLAYPKVWAAMDMSKRLAGVCMRILREDKDQIVRLSALEILHALVQSQKQEQQQQGIAATASGLLDLCVVVSRFEADMPTGAEALSILQLLAEDREAAARLLKRDAIAICRTHVANAKTASTTAWKLLVELTATPGAQEALASTDRIEAIVAAAVKVWGRALARTSQATSVVDTNQEWWALIALQNLAAYEETQEAVFKRKVCVTCVNILQSDLATPAIVEHSLGILSNLSRKLDRADVLLASGAADAALDKAVDAHLAPAIRCAALRLLQNLSASAVGREALIVRDCPGKCVSLAVKEAGAARFHALATLSNLLAPRHGTGAFVPVDDAALLLSPHQIDFCIALCRAAVAHPDRSVRGSQVMAMALLHRFSRMTTRPACMLLLREHGIVALCSNLVRRCKRAPSSWYNAEARGYSVEGYALLILYELAHDEHLAEIMLQDLRLMQRLARLASLAADRGLKFARITASLTLFCLAHPPALCDTSLDDLLALVDSAVSGRCDEDSFFLEWPVEDLLTAVDAGLDDDHNRITLLPRLASRLADFISEAHSHPQTMHAVSTEALAAALRIVDQQSVMDANFVEIPRLIRSALQDEMRRLPQSPMSCSLLVRIVEER
ncbi:Hypothetical Protein FCC1311_070002 [Hondaea fermentalgiana]|uniref:Uncharacterized protein n=1 Tax=Hondaea fermentalgiana TaxID=2315210 RepID=A0A2R5GIR1_9STRA|nr:Hypothetical Protein FCC1311_070002 [Hondaea fermentalgiana]|eukprot:GBG30780.1 Hypothetical Protein FCC1311_070002 [Hondaea fermentalgiana]